MPGESRLGHPSRHDVEHCRCLDCLTTRVRAAASRRDGGHKAPNDVRNRIARAAVELTEAHRAKYPYSRRGQYKGWRELGRRTGVDFRLLKRACEGKGMQLARIEEVSAAILKYDAARAAENGGAP